MVTDLDQVGALDELDVAEYEARVRKIKDIVGERQRFIEIS
jgi:hypothetical protein